MAQIFDKISEQLTESISKQARESNAKLFSKELVKPSAISIPVVSINKTHTSKLTKRIK